MRLTPLSALPTKLCNTPAGMAHTINDTPNTLCYSIIKHYTISEPRKRLLLQIVLEFLSVTISLFFGLNFIISCIIIKNR